MVSLSNHKRTALRQAQGQRGTYPSIQVWRPTSFARKRESFLLPERRPGDVYESIASVREITEIWDQLAFLLDQGDVDHETVFEISDGFDSHKVMYGPAYTIAFQTEPDGSLILFYIRRSGFLR